MKIAIYPGSFDPITNGHIDVIDRSSIIFDKMIISITNSNSNKNQFFSIEERVDMIKESIKSYPNVEVKIFDGLLVDFAIECNATSIIRGLRALSDFEYEFQMALMNRNLNEKISTVFLMPHQKYTHISSSLVKEVASLGGDVSNYVPRYVMNILKLKYDK